MSAAIDILKKEVVAAVASSELIKKEEKATIDAGKRSQRKVDDAARLVRELSSAVMALSQIERGQQVAA